MEVQCGWLAGALPCQLKIQDAHRYSDLRCDEWLRFTPTRPRAQEVGPVRVELPRPADAPTHFADLFFGVSSDEPAHAGEFLDSQRLSVRAPKDNRQH